jgi:hypothetical protein
MELEQRIKGKGKKKQERARVYNAIAINCLCHVLLGMQRERFVGLHVAFFATVPVPVFKLAQETRTRMKTTHEKYKVLTQLNRLLTYMYPTAHRMSPLPMFQQVHENSQIPVEQDTPSIAEHPQRDFLYHRHQPSESDIAPLRDFQFRRRMIAFRNTTPPTLLVEIAPLPPCRSSLRSTKGYQRKRGTCKKSVVEHSSDVCVNACSYYAALPWWMVSATFTCI